MRFFSKYKALYVNPLGNDSEYGWDMRVFVEPGIFARLLYPYPYAITYYIPADPNDCVYKFTTCGEEPCDVLESIRIRKLLAETIEGDEDD